jgi:hypothetical protein
MISSRDCLAKYGEPELEHAMFVWDVPAELELGVIPKRFIAIKIWLSHFKKRSKTLFKEISSTS